MYLPATKSPGFGIDLLATAAPPKKSQVVTVRNRPVHVTEAPDRVGTTMRNTASPHKVWRTLPQKWVVAHRAGVKRKPPRVKSNGFSC
jgi:hypothetical protein